MKRAIAVAVLIAFSPVAVKAAGILSMQGRCTKFTVRGHDITRGCVNKIVNAYTDNGRTVFMFMFADGAIISFGGAGEKQVKLSPDRVIQPIDDVLFNLGIEGVPPNKMPAVGACRYGNPYKGVSTVSCSAQTKDGAFSGTFITDGSPPRDAH